MRERERERERDRQTDRQTDIHTDTHTERKEIQRERERERKKERMRAASFNCTRFLWPLVECALMFLPRDAIGHLCGTPLLY